VFLLDSKITVFLLDSKNTARQTHEKIFL